MRSLVISERAEADLREIWRWSCGRFGEAQADLYLDQIDAGLRECGMAPERGQDHESIREGYRSKLIRKHVAFYTFDDTEVVVQRVLHGSMDPERHV